MAKFTRIQNSFIAGELSPRFYGRTNLDEYTQGLKTLKNMFVYPQGGVSKRPGTIIQVEDLPEESRLISFVISKSESYIFVLSTGGTDNDPSSAIKIYQNSSAGLVEKSIGVFISGGTAQFPAYLSNAAVEFLGWNAWTTKAQIDALDFSQSGEVLLITDKENAPIIISTGITSAPGDDFGFANWFNANAIFNPTYQTYNGTNSGVQEKITSASRLSAIYKSFPYEEFDIAGGTVAPNATSGTNVTVTDGSASLNFNGKLEVKNVIRATNSGTTGFGLVKSVSGSSFTLETEKAFGSTGNFDSLEINQWGFVPSTLKYWPRLIIFAEQRVIFAANEKFPLTLWGSQQGDIAELMLERSADDSSFGDISNDRPFSFSISASDLSELNWIIQANRRIFIGSESGEYSITGPDSNLSLGPLNVSVRKETSYGSEAIKPIPFEGGFIFVEAGGYKLREFVFNRDEDSFRANDLNLYAEHLSRYSDNVFASPTSSGFKKLSYSKVPYQTIWTIDGSGYICSLVRERLSGVSGWSRHELGGESASGEPPIVIDVATLPNSDGYNNTYFLVKRTVNGSTKITLENIATEYSGTTLNQTSSSIYDWPVYVDAAQLLTPETNISFMANYSVNYNGNVYDGSQIAAVTGSPAITNGKLVLTSAGQYVSYDATDNADMQQAGCIRLRVTPNYTGTPAAERTFIAISKASGDADNLIEIKHTAAGNLEYVILDQAGSSVASGSAAWSPTSGTEYELLLDFDITGGSNTLYVDGSSHATDSGTGTRSADIDYLVIGTDEAQNNDPDFSISYFAIYSTDGAGSTVQARVYGKYLQTQGSIYFGQDTQALSSGQMVADDTSLYGHVQLSSDPVTDKVLVGLKYESELQTLDIEAGSILGSAQGQIKRIEEIMLRFYNTVGAKYGYSASNTMDEIEFRNYQYGDDEAITLFTGDKVVKFPHGYDRNYHVTVQHDKPYPMHLSCIVMRGLTYD